MLLPNKGTPEGSPDDWLEHAASDLKVARLAHAHEEILSEHVCFHAQQAAEKAIKAVLIERKIEFPLTHNIGTLLSLGGRAGVKIPPRVAGAKALTPYAVQGRYPWSWGEISREDADRALRLAEATVAWATQIIGSGRKAP